MKPKWNWKDIQRSEYKARYYFTKEQFRWLKKVVRSMYRYACEERINLPTPYIGLSLMCFYGYEKSKCAVIVFERGTVRYSVTVDVIGKDKIDLNGYRYDGCILSSMTILQADPRLSLIPHMVHGWSSAVRERREQGWYGPFWLAYYGITKELPWQLRIHWERFKQRFSKKAPMSLQIAICNAYLHWCVFLRNISQKRFRIALRSLCGMCRKW